MSSVKKKIAKRETKFYSAEKNEEHPFLRSQVKHMNKMKNESNAKRNLLSAKEKHRIEASKDD